jgi:hypothetical protein
MQHFYNILFKSEQNTNKERGKKSQAAPRCKYRNNRPEHTLHTKHYQKLLTHVTET